MELSSLPVMLMLVSLLPLAHAQAKPTITLRSFSQSLINSEDTITLSCDLQNLRGWEFFWYRNKHIVSNVAPDTNTFSVNLNNAGETEYQCGARWKSNYNTVYSDPVKITANVKPQPSVRVNPESSIYTGDTITLSCELQETTGWKFFWYKNSQLVNTVATNTLRITVDNAGEPVYQCRASRTIYSNHNNYQYFYTGLSDSVTIKAKERLQPVLSVSPQNWLTEGDSVTLSCEVTDSSTDWTFSWYTVVPYRDGLTAIHNSHGYLMYVELLSDSSRGSGGSYTLSPSALHHTGVYVCRGERGEPVSYTMYSNPQPLWISGESPPVFLIISPSRTQHFTRDSLSLSCEDQSNSTGWTVRRYTDSKRVLDCSQWGSVTGSTCKFSFLYTSYTGVYWCKSESGENSNPVNITVHVSGSSDVEAPFPVLMLISRVVTPSPYLLITIILLVKFYRAQAHTGDYGIEIAVIEE